MWTVITLSLAYIKETRLLLGCQITLHQVRKGNRYMNVADLPDGLVLTHAGSFPAIDKLVIL